MCDFYDAFYRCNTTVGIKWCTNVPTIYLRSFIAKMHSKDLILHIVYFSINWEISATNSLLTGSEGSV